MSANHDFSYGFPEKTTLEETDFILIQDKNKVIHFITVANFLDALPEPEPVDPG
jgi:hypothetical protein